MVSFDQKIPRIELVNRLQKLMLLRVLFVSILLGALIFIQVRETRTYFGGIQTYHYFIIVAIYFLTFIYIFFLGRLKNLTLMAYIQLIVDTLFVTAIIYTTGGIESFFSFLYLLTIINASTLLYRRGGMIVASSSSIFYGMLLDLHYYNVIHPFGSRLIYPEDFQSTYIFYIILVNIAAFYIVAFISSYPSEQARKSRVELRAKQDDLTKLEALNEWIIRSINSGLITLDSQDRIILFNPAAEEIFNLKAAQAINHPLTEVLPFLEPYLKEEPSGHSNDIPSPRHFTDLPFEKHPKKTIFLRLFTSPLILPKGEQRGRILIFQDMTQIKKIEEEMKKVEGLALIGELAAGITHEIRNPMASISGSIQMLKDRMNDDEVNHRLMDITLREINRLNHLISDFLLFARPNPVEFVYFNLKQLILESLELVRNSERWYEDLEIETNLNDSIILRSDPEQIKQVLWNLLLNAVEAMPEGGQIKIRTGIVSSPSEKTRSPQIAQLMIRDTGPGFPPKILNNLFTPFLTTKRSGSGLGLAIVKRIVEGLDGKIQGKNHPGGGAEIEIQFRMSEGYEPHDSEGGVNGPV